MEADELRAHFRGHSFIRVTPVGWEPAERYKVEYWIRGVVLAPGASQPSFAEYFTASIVLPNDYPRVKPLCTMETPVFHPNFGTRADDEICIADYWTPSQSISDIVIKIGEMLQYQDYNVKSPLNAVAARWADSNRGVLPVGSKDVTRLGSSSGVRANSSDREATDHGPA